MSSAFGRAVDSFLSYFRPTAPKALPDLENLRELTPADFQSRRETYPLYPLAGWDPVRIIQMLESHDVGNFQASELFYHALTKEGLIGSALEQRIAASQEIDWSLQCPKDAPDEFHVFTEALARDWQAVMPDDVRAEVIERTNVFGFQVCRLQWVWNNGQRQPLLIPYTHSSLSYRQDLWCYQGMSERGIEYISSDGREWVVFSLGGTRPWLKGLIRRLAFVYFGIITGDDRWLNFNDKFAEPIKNRIIPRMMREQAEPQRLYAKESAMRGGDMVISPQDEKGNGYDLKYVQVDAQGYKTLQDQLARMDERAAIIILGHNLLQSVKGGSLAAMKAAMKLLRSRAVKDVGFLSAGFEPVSKVWARANFGTGSDPSEWPELLGAPPETKTWSLVFDTTDPDEKQAQAVMAAQFSQGFATFAKATGPKLFELSIDWEEAAERAGIPMLRGEDSYTETDEEAQLDSEEYITPPAHVIAAARRALSWAQDRGANGMDAGRQMARKIIKGRLTRADVAKMAAYYPRHEADQRAPGWGNLKRPSNGRIAWGLWGDNGDGRGWAWAKREAEALRILAALPTEEDLGPRVMIALVPRPDDASALALRGGEAPEDLHITLGYLGRARELPPQWLATLHQQAAAVAQQSAPLVGRVGGVGRFSGSPSSDGRDVCYAAPNVLGLIEIRQKLAAACAAAGVPFRATHGYTPHITLAYLDPGAPLPIVRAEGMPLHFDAVWVCMEGSRWEFPFSGSSVQVLADDARPAPLLLASGDSPDSAAGLIEGQNQIDRMADERWDAPGLLAALGALAAAADWSDLRSRLAGLVREHDLTAQEGALEDRLHQAAAIGRESVDHDLPTAMRAEVDAADRKLSQCEKLAEVQGSQRRQARLARIASAGFLFAVAKSLWEQADRAGADGQPLDLRRSELAELLHRTWGDGGSRWESARAEPLQHAFTFGRVHRLNDPSLLAVFPYWRLDAVLDGRTTPLCRGLSGYTRPAGDPSFPVPPLHYHCRSTVRGVARAEGEASVSAPQGVVTDPGFGSLDAYPEPSAGPDELLRAYRERSK